jgi:hypothetical protein
MATRLTEQQIEAIRRRLEASEYESAMEYVAAGGDLDYGRVSRLEWIATGKIVVSAQDIDALCYDAECTLNARQHIEDQVRNLTEGWLSSPRGEEYLEQKVSELLPEELEQELERMEEALVDQLMMRADHE